MLKTTLTISETLPRSATVEDRRDSERLDNVDVDTVETLMAATNMTKYGKVHITFTSFHVKVCKVLCVSVSLRYDQYQYIPVKPISRYK